MPISIATPPVRAAITIALLLLVAASTLVSPITSVASITKRALCVPAP